MTPNQKFFWFVLLLAGIFWLVLRRLLMTRFGF